VLVDVIVVRVVEVAFVQVVGVAFMLNRRVPAVRAVPMLVAGVDRVGHPRMVGEGVRSCQFDWGGTHSHVLPTSARRPLRRPDHNGT
jgi:hypothetical protein